MSRVANDEDDGIALTEVGVEFVRHRVNICLSNFMRRKVERVKVECSNFKVVHRINGDMLMGA